MLLLTLQMYIHLEKLLLSNIFYTHTHRIYQITFIEKPTLIKIWSANMLISGGALSA